MIEKIRSLKNKEKITMLTAYDCPTAKTIGKLGIDIILVGDSVGNVLLGYENTKSVTMDDMLHHTRAVARARPESLIVFDMPYQTYEEEETAITNAKKAIEAGAQAVKIEGNKIEIIKALIKNNIKVMGHIGLTPQTIEDYKVQGTDEQAIKDLINQAKELEQIGIFSIVLECIPSEVAKIITKQLTIPTIGIGAGKYCDGQVLVINDLLGIGNFNAKFIKKFANLQKKIEKAITEFKQEVKDSKFPEEKHSYTLKDKEILKKFI